MADWFALKFFSITFLRPKWTISNFFYQILSVTKRTFDKNHEKGYAKFLGIIFERKLQEEKGRVKAAILGVERLNDCVDFNARFKHDV